MKALTLLALCGVAALAGCQVSGRGEVDTTGRPEARATATAGYSMPYEAAEDTEWASSSDMATATRGTVRRGEIVMFNRAPDTSAQWQQARLADGTVRYVRPTAFRMSSSR